MADSAIWVKVFPSTGSGDEGGPGWDVLTVAQSGLNAQMSWPAAGGTPTSYEISVNGIIQDVGNVLTYLKTGLTLGVEHTFKVRAMAAGLAGGWSAQEVLTLSGFNAATGGVVATVTNYNGTGQTWKVHTFDTNGTFTVQTQVSAFTALACGGGGGGGGSNNAVHGGAGGGGKVSQNAAAAIPAGTHAVTVGAGGPGGGGNGDGQTGGASSLGSVASATGGAGCYANAGGTVGVGGGGNITSTITGVSAPYGTDALPWDYGGYGSNGAGKGGGGGAAEVGTNSGGTGTPGVVIVAYRIA